MTAARRRWLYGIAVAVVALAVGYGLISQSEAALWLALAAAAFAGGSNVVASAHVADVKSTGRHAKGS